MTVEPETIVAKARTLAARLLSSMGNRWLHVQAVGARATELVTAVNANDAELLVASAWLHDIGYSSEIALTGFHPLDGAVFLEREGFSARLVGLVAHHSGAIYEAEQRGYVRELARYVREDGPVLDALTTADMTIGPTGERIEFAQRIRDILSRYPANSPVHQAIHRAKPSLSAAVERTYARLVD